MLSEVAAAVNYVRRYLVRRRTNPSDHIRRPISRFLPLSNVTPNLIHLTV